ncbi:hypothetical protein ACH5RR_012360 [Cinchona calisaya]|uniref:Uncharacterized protein n=1 Tax=Cinchona calisaya TaxID=153742 RepID=A0ABD3A924_9GENT
MTSTQKMLKDEGYAVNNLLMGFGYRPYSLMRLVIKRVNMYHITIKEETASKDSRRLVFDRLKKVTIIPVFDRLSRRGRILMKQPIYEKLSFLKVQEYIFNTKGNNASRNDRSLRRRGNNASCNDGSLRRRVTNLFIHYEDS